MKPILLRVFALMVMCVSFAGVCRYGYADTPDLTEYLAGVVDQVRCAGSSDSSVGVFADVDGNSVNDTLVVLTSVQGEAYAQGQLPNLGWGLYVFFFTGIRSQCSGDDGVGRIFIRFVDMLTPGFNPDPSISSPWVYKGVPGAQLVVSSDTCVVAGAPIPYRSMKAYTEIDGGGTLVGSFTTGTYPDFATSQQTCEFSNLGGIKEIQIRTDFCENRLKSLILRSSTTSGGADAGLRVADGTGVRRIACEFPDATGNVASPIRFFKNGATYGIILTDTDSPSASKVRIQTSSGVKALMKLP